jgi:hypothetical protein
MTLATVKYIRKPFEVDAVQVTADNMQEVADWCSGTIVVEKDKQDKLQQFIKVNAVNVTSDRQTQAFVGDWVLSNGNGYKVYTNKAFSRTFDKRDLSEHKTPAIAVG